MLLIILCCLERNKFSEAPVHQLFQLFVPVVLIMLCGDWPIRSRRSPPSNQYYTKRRKKEEGEEEEEAKAPLEENNSDSDQRKGEHFAMRRKKLLNIFIDFTLFLVTCNSDN